MLPVAFLLHLLCYFFDRCRLHICCSGHRSQSSSTAPSPPPPLEPPHRFAFATAIGPPPLSLRSSPLGLPTPGNLYLMELTAAVGVPNVKCAVKTPSPEMVSLFFEAV
ncbi:hypothetical protein GUJ93_ZPchr0006g43947 [Zizania palustris]|uniref:Secreted protein n=1 Tax=Zizania palustris TaxID=103762 RepID=A0A8J5SHE9_ZIZPA|nr:hypothetical protein GUJ93_ZPchr0006g43947 [Zizania palustris]